LWAFSVVYEASVKTGELIGIAQQVMALFPAVLNVGFAAVPLLGNRVITCPAISRPYRQIAHKDGIFPTRNNFLLFLDACRSYEFTASDGIPRKNPRLFSV